MINPAAHAFTIKKFNLVKSVGENVVFKRNKYIQHELENEGELLSVFPHLKKRIFNKKINNSKKTCKSYIIAYPVYMVLKKCRDKNSLSHNNLHFYVDYKFEEGKLKTVRRKKRSWKTNNNNNTLVDI